MAIALHGLKQHMIEGIAVGLLPEWGYRRFPWRIAMPSTIDNACSVRGARGAGRMIPIGGDRLDRPVLSRVAGIHATHFPAGPVAVVEG